MPEPVKTAPFGMALDSYSAECTYFAQRPLTLNKGQRNERTYCFYDMKLEITVEPRDLRNSQWLPFGFRLEDIPSERATQTTIEDGDDDAPKADMSAWDAPDGKEWRAAFGGSKTASDEDERHVLVMEHPVTGEVLRLVPTHGLALSTITPDTNKNTTTPRARFGVMVKGLGSNLGAIEFRSFTGSNLMHFNFEDMSEPEHNEALRIKELEKGPVNKAKGKAAPVAEGQTTVEDAENQDPTGTGSAPADNPDAEPRGIRFGGVDPLQLDEIPIGFYATPNDAPIHTRTKKGWKNEETGEEISSTELRERFTWQAIRVVKPTGSELTAPGWALNVVDDEDGGEGDSEEPETDTAAPVSATAEAPAAKKRGRPRKDAANG